MKHAALLLNIARVLLLSRGKDRVERIRAFGTLWILWAGRRRISNRVRDDARPKILEIETAQRDPTGHPGINGFAILAPYLLGNIVGVEVIIDRIWGLVVTS